MSISRWVERAEAVVSRIKQRRAVIQIGRYYWLAERHRDKLNHVQFIGVTGSCGKTTTKELIAAVLATRWEGVKTTDSRNTGAWIPKTVLATRPHHGFSVFEIAAYGPGSMAAPVGLVRPGIGVVTNIGADHLKAYASIDAIAEEKGTLVAGLGADGIAVLNADDPRVLAMRSRFAGRVVTFGLAADADVRAEQIRAAWPDRLSFTAVHQGEAVPLHTRLCGEHWVGSVLAAIATGLVAGVPLEDAARAVAAIEPWEGRMSPLFHEDGIVFIRDDWKAPLRTIAPALDFVRQARASRKVVVIGTISDYSASASRVYRGVARDALAVADQVIFVGRQSRHAMRARDDTRPDALHAFPTVLEAHQHLDRSLRPGDLVLIKGSNRADHLSRIFLNRTQRVRCWRTACGRKKFCHGCLLVGIPFSAVEEAAGPNHSAGDA